MAGRRTPPTDRTEPCLVAMVGFGRGLRRSGYGILRRSRTSRYLLPDIDRALTGARETELRSTGWCSTSETRPPQGNLRRFLALGQARPESALIILYRGRLKSTSRSWLCPDGGEVLSIKGRHPPTPRVAHPDRAGSFSNGTTRASSATHPGHADHSRDIVRPLT